MTRRPTIRDLAEASGVSAATVDRVLHARHAVREATALRVLEAAQRIGFYAEPVLQQRMIGPLPTLKIALILPPTEVDFYTQFEAEAQRAAASIEDAKVSVTTLRLARVGAPEVVAALEAAAQKADAIGLVSIDHPQVTAAVEALVARGVPVIALLSDFAQGSRTAYVGTNNLKVGRTAASMLARGVPATAAEVEVAIFVGGHRWHGHDLRETGFRSWFRQNRPEISVLATQINLDSAELTYEATLALLETHPRLAGIYCAGGGREGVIRAVMDEHAAGRVDIVANELTEITRQAMVEGAVSLVIDTPSYEICRAAFRMALDAVPAGQKFVPMTLVIPESL